MPQIRTGYGHGMTSQSAKGTSTKDVTISSSHDRLARHGDRTRKGSATLAVIGDGATFYAAVPILIYVVLSEVTSKGVDDHDRVANVADRHQIGFEDATGRLIDTIDLVAGIAYADGDLRNLIAETMREVHRHIEGTLDDGTRYHAWNKQAWSWTWAGILKLPLDAYQELHGQVTEEFAEDYYIGMLQVGDLIGVRGLPETYADFLGYWEREWMPLAQGTGTGKFLFSLANAAPWIPRPIWTAVTWPFLNLMRAGTFIVMEPRILAMLDAHPTPIQRLSVVVHRLIWRVTPRVLTRNLFGAFIKLRLRRGNNSWNRHYSPDALADYHRQVEDARAQGCPQPARPSKRH
jgi:uncharacterized protein (DUF2236 family)